MKCVACFRDLEQFGIKCLTGEADALGFRILCDLTEQGVRVFRECFGIPSGPLAENWNSGAVASVMLTEESIKPLAVIGFYFKGHTVVVTDTAVYALEDGEDIVVDDSGEYKFVRQQYRHRWSHTIQRIIRPKVSDGQRVQGTRNVHQATGRVS